MFGPRTVRVLDRLLFGLALALIVAIFVGAGWLWAWDTMRVRAMRSEVERASPIGDRH